MTDVLLVCVRSDVGPAEILAELFEKAGFSIGDGSVDDATLAASGAGVVIWSDQALQSRSFLRAAERLLNTGKGVIATLARPPLPAELDGVPHCDLSAWSGELDDEALNPLFFMVDRLVQTARDQRVEEELRASALKAWTADLPTSRLSPPKPETSNVIRWSLAR